MIPTPAPAPARADDRPAAGPPPAVAPLRVLHCYAGNLYGGIEALLATLARQGAAAPGLAAEFALCFPGRLADELRAAGATTHDLGPVQFRKPWTILRARRRLRQVLERAAPDVVVCHACWPHALFAPVVRRAGVPLAFWMHDAAGGRHWLDRLAARTPPDLALINSRYTAATLPHLFPGARHEVIPYPVEPPAVADRAAARAAIRRELATPDDAVVVLQTSRLERWKGQSLLIAALGRLRDRPGWVAWLAGGAQRPHEQAYLAELKAAADAAGIADRVRFLGQRSDVPRLLAAADLHCQPNTGPEPFGIAFVEALYAGLPVVSTRMGGAAEIVTADCGVLTPPGDADALAGALADLMADPAARSRLAAGGPPRAAALSDPAAVLDRLRGLLAAAARPEDPAPC